MRYITGGIALGLAVSLGGLAPSAGAQPAQPPEPQSLYAPSALVLTVGQGADAATAGIQRAVTLSCTPTTTGTHPDPAGACAELRTADGNFDTVTMAPSDRICTKEWRPVVVTAEGVWEGRRVSYEHTFPNLCGMTDGKGRIFAF
ncbi:subtilase-type protease inhibitor [Streptomyces sp. NBC_01142]|uniref:subtilase-type protease inhibitor n=1 Tax=Streptomyces sp. NBC_01142 TaxID=2975865 RepID=UPI00224F8E11|nr:subtilase-type protease inhibitor [Streptomyces sp. NBC_01142]MCX4822059.1 subtilase-type protease inhibitor [Streptomyces sp. NBC_01142]